MNALKKWEAEGTKIIYDPTPGGVPNENGGRSFSLRLPALEVTEWVADREKTAVQIADALNSDDAKDAEIARLTRELAEEKECVEDLRAEVERHSKAAAASRFRASEAKDALIECEDYFDNRADADCDQDGYIPNEEMKLLQVVRDAIRKAGAE